MNRTAMSVVAIALLLIVAGFFLLGADEPQITQQNNDVTPVVVSEPQAADLEPVAIEPEFEQNSEVVIELDLMAAPATLNDSDGAVTKVIAGLSAKALLWMVPEEQIRRWVQFVDNLADGVVISKNRPLKFNMGKLPVDSKGGKTYLSPQAYGRATLLVDTFVAIPPEMLAAYLYRWNGIVEQAYKELGRRGKFKQRVVLAIDKLLAVELPESPPELHRPSVMYVYADENLEKSNDVTKLLIRLGPQNTQKLQAYLSQLKEAL